VHGHLDKSWIIICTLCILDQMIVMLPNTFVKVVDLMEFILFGLKNI